MAGNYEYFIRVDDFARDSKKHGFAKSLDECIALFKAQADCTRMSVFNEKSNQMWFYEKGN